MSHFKVIIEIINITHKKLNGRSKTCPSTNPPINAEVLVEL